MNENNFLKNLHFKLDVRKQIIFAFIPSLEIAYNPFVKFLSNSFFDRSIEEEKIIHPSKQKSKNIENFESKYNDAMVIVHYEDLLFYYFYFFKIIFFPGIKIVYCLLDKEIMKLFCKVFILFFLLFIKKKF